ncbi:MAG: replicative DNA helicase [Candidatus Uhrbacteria bacterium]|nr:replicative DNA helicase [Patescibacteria group bacterium]MBU1906776.1 replicative DNA helicase [Patescibacteria group bacterium]
MSTQERIPPQNLEAEQSLLGSLLIDKDAVIKVGDKVRSDDFYKESHGHIYDAVTYLFSRHEPIDILSVGNRLEELGKLQGCGGRAYLVELSNAVPTSSHATHYSNIVQKKATLRRLISSASQISALGFDEADDVEATLDKAEQSLFAVSQKYMKQTFTSLRSVLSDAFERIDDLHKNRGKLRGISTGFGELDNILGGLQNSDLVVLAARPSVGKTSLALDMARAAAIRSKKPVGIFSLEMSKEQLVDRMICAEANVDLWKLRTGRLSDRDDDFPRIGQALGTLSEAPIFIDDAPGANVMEIRTKARRLQTEHGLGMIVIDYIQLMESRAGGSDNRVQQVSEITRSLKGIARELDVPVLALSQLSRTTESMKPAIPRLSHLRESGSIEQDADVVMFIYRKAADKNYRADELAPEEKRLAEIHIAKHRNGPTGVVKLMFDEKRASFVSLERRRVTPPPSSQSAKVATPAQYQTSASQNPSEVPPPPKGAVDTKEVPF